MAPGRTVAATDRGSFVSSTGYDPGAWIGFSDFSQEGTFQWADGEPVTYTNWANGQPDNYQPLGGEDYGEFNFGTGLWNDSSGTATFGAILLNALLSRGRR